MLLKMPGNHLKCKIANKNLNVYEWVEAVERKKDGPLPSTAVKGNLDRTKSKLLKEVFSDEFIFSSFLCCVSHIF